MDEFKEKYPFAVYSRFYYDSDYGGIYYKDPNTGESTLVDSKEFQSNLKYTYWLMANKDKVLAANAKMKFQKKYPNADLSKFQFQPFEIDVLVYYKVGSYQILADIKNFWSKPNYVKPLSLNFPPLWMSNGKVPQFNADKYQDSPKRGCNKRVCGIIMDTKFFVESDRPG